MDSEYLPCPECGTELLTYVEEIQAYACMECDAAFSVEEIEDL